MHKLIVSPEFGDKLDLRRQVKEMMAQMELDLGTKLQWVAVEHFNTDNPHVHIAVRGVDDKGRQLEVAPNYIKEGARLRAQESATRQLGYRTERDVAEALERQITQQRFTDIDRVLLRAANTQGTPNLDYALLRDARKQTGDRLEIDFKASKMPTGEKARALRLAQIQYLVQLEGQGLAQRVGDMRWRLSPSLGSVQGQSKQVKPIDQHLLINFEGGIPAGEQARAMRLKQIRRLVELQKMGLAERVGNMTWKLSPSLESALRQMQMSQDRLKLKFQHREQISDPSAPLVSTELKTVGQRVAGRLVGTGLDEATNRPYMMVEAFDGKVHYLTQSPKIQQLRGQGMRLGDYVALEVLQRNDKPGGFIQVEHFGRSLPPAAIDKELLATGKPVERITTHKTVAGAFLAAASERQQLLLQAGAVDIVEGRLVQKSRLAHDLVRYADQGITASRDAPQGIFLGKVLVKGQESLVARSGAGVNQVLTAAALAELGLEAKFVGKEATVFVGLDHKGKRAAFAIADDKVQAMVNDPRPNRLDLVAQQASGFATGPIKSAIEKRTALWSGRGVDLMSPTFTRDAGAWRKSFELHQAAIEKGVEPVIEQFSRDRGKPTREMVCEPGRQVTGRVLLVNKSPEGTTIVVDSGRELTVLRQPAPADVDLKAGQRIRARPDLVEQQQRQAIWRFADLEREEAREKGRQGKHF